MQAIRVHQIGGPDVLRLEASETPQPGAGEVLIKVVVAGVNYADVGQRAGMMGGPHRVELPFTPGFEVAGTVAALGEGVQGPPPGTRVAAVLDSGGYAEYAVAPADKLFPLPPGLDFAPATAMLVQGLTAYSLIHDAAKVQKGESVLIEAAAGGVGSLLVQLAKAAGAGTVVGTVGSADKMDLVRDLGADVVINYSDPEWVQQVYGATQGRGVDVVFESVGGAVGAGSFNALAPLGRMILFGGASGQPLPFHELMMPLNVKGLSLIGYGGPWLRPGRAQVGAQELGRMIQSGQLKVVIGQTFPLAEAAAAHRALEERRTVGKTVLTM